MKAYELLINTARYYGEDPVARRAVDDQGCCCYITEGHQKCAIGRYLKPQDAAYADLENLGPEALKERWLLEDTPLKDIDPEDLNHIQLFHDANGNWGEKGLSPLGRNHFKNLTRRFKS